MQLGFKPPNGEILHIGYCTDFVTMVLKSWGEVLIEPEEDNIWIRGVYCSVCAMTDRDMRLEFYLDKLQEGQILVNQSGLGDSFEESMDLFEFVRKLPSEMDIEDFNVWETSASLHIECKEGVLSIWIRGKKRAKKKALEKDIGPERLWEILIGDIMCINAHEEIFLEVIRTLENKKIEYELGSTAVLIRGHGIDVSCSHVRTKDFQIVFCAGVFLMVDFGKEIAESSAFITTKGNKHNIGDILRKNTDKKSSSVWVCGYGADDAWHHIYNNSEMVYGIRYDL